MFTCGMLGQIRRLTVKQHPVYMYGSNVRIQQQNLRVWENACSLAAAHPEMAVGVAAGALLFYVAVVEMVQEFQLEFLLFKDTTGMAEEHIKREHELRQNVKALEKQLEKARKLLEEAHKLPEEARK
jgi:hypothetical protein